MFFLKFQWCQCYVINLITHVFLCFVLLWVVWFISCISNRFYFTLVCSVYRNHILVLFFIHIFASQGLRFGSPFSPPLADLEYILRIRALIFHWLRLPVYVSNQKTFYTDHMLSTKCKQRCHFPFWFQWKHLSRLPKLWNFSLGRQ